MSDTKSSPRRTYTRREKITAAAVAAGVVVALGGGAWASTRDDSSGQGDAPKPIAQQYDEAQAEVMREYDPPGRDTSKAVCQQVTDDLDVYADRELYPRVAEAAEELRRIHRCDRWKLTPMTEAREKLEKAARQKRDAEKQKREAAKPKPKPAASTAAADPTGGEPMGGPYPDAEQPVAQLPLWQSDPELHKTSCRAVLDAHNAAKYGSPPNKDEAAAMAKKWKTLECERARLLRFSDSRDPVKVLE